jgi:hypothetical protein
VFDVTFGQRPQQPAAPIQPTDHGRMSGLDVYHQSTC